MVIYKKLNLVGFLFALVFTLAFVSCKKEAKMLDENIYPIEIDKDEFVNLDFKAKIYSVGVTSLNDWKVISYPQWVEFDVVEYKGSELSKELSFKVLENKQEEKREDKITLQASNNKSVTIVISQLEFSSNQQDNTNQPENVVIPIYADPNSFLQTSYEKAILNATVGSSNNWEIISKPDWVEFKNTQYQGSQIPRELNIYISINDSGALREGKIVLRASDNSEAEINISQSFFKIEEGHQLYFNNDIIPSRAEGLTKNVQIGSTWRGPFEIKVDDNWVRYTYSRPSATSFTSSDYATLHFQDNYLPEERTTSLYLFKKALPEDILVAVYKITQQAAYNYLDISKSDFQARAKGEEFQFEVKSNEDFQITGTPDWIKTEKTKNSENNYSVKIIVNENLSEVRKANFSISLNSGSLSKSLSVTQEAGFVQKYPFNLPYGVILKAQTAERVHFVGANYQPGNYANRVYLNIPSDKEAVTQTTNRYGFVIDPPLARNLVTPVMETNRNLSDMGKPYAIIEHQYYNGKASSFNMELTITAGFATYFRRVAIPNLPIPANLTSEDKLIYTIEIFNISSNTKFEYKISYEIK